MEKELARLGIVAAEEEARARRRKPTPIKTQGQDGARGVAILREIESELERESEWPFYYTDEQVRRFGQGEPDGETWAYIVATMAARERLVKLREALRLIGGPALPAICPLPGDSFGCPVIQ